MSMRRIVLLGLAGLLLAGASIPPAITAIRNQKEEPAIVADDMPPPVECGWLELCRTTQTA